MLHFDPSQTNVYKLNGIPIDTVTSHKDLGILFDNKLKFHLNVTAKENHITGLIKKSFNYLEPNMMSRLLILKH